MEKKLISARELNIWSTIYSPNYYKIKEYSVIKLEAFNTNKIKIKLAYVDGVGDSVRKTIYYECIAGENDMGFKDYLGNWFYTTIELAKEKQKEFIDIKIEELTKSVRIASDKLYDFVSEIESNG